MAVGAPGRALFVTHPHLGDAVASSPFGGWLRRAWPDARITALTGASGLEILSATGAFDVVAARPEGRLARARWSLALRRAPVDVAVFCYSHRGLLRAARRGGVRELWVVQGDRPFPGADREASPVGDEREVPDALARLLVEAGIEAGDTAPDLRPSEEQHARAASLAQSLEDADGPPVALHPGASHAAKRWPADRWAALSQEVRARSFSPVWIGIHGQADTVASLNPCATDLCGAFSPLGTAAFLARCRALVSADSGPVHLAGAVGCPVVGLYGPTSARQFRPWGEGHRLLQAGCPHGCGGLDACRGDCMASHSVESVLEALRAVLQP